MKLDQLGEALAKQAFDHQREVQWMQTQVIASAVIDAASRIVSAVVRSDSPPSQSLSDTLYSFKDILFPELAGEKDAKAKRIKQLMKEVEKDGPIKIKPLGSGRKG